MSLPDSESTRPTGILVRRTTSNVFTAMLGIAVAAMTLGSLFLFLELLRYDWIWNTPWSQRP